jgi:hypothetical protein
MDFGNSNVATKAMTNTQSSATGEFAAKSFAVSLVPGFAETVAVVSFFE